MRRVLIFGQPFAAARIVRAINSAPGEMTAQYVPESHFPRLLVRPPRRDDVAFVRAGYRVGGTTARARAFDMFWTALRRLVPDAPACHFWLGSDVLNTLNDARSGTLRRAVVRAAANDTHVAVAPWLTDELQSIGIPAITLLLAPPVTPPEAAPALPARFAVLTYLPARRFAFYGGDLTLAVAGDLPDVQFDVVAHDGAGMSAPSNVVWHGWVQDMPVRYAASTVILRVPAHDGYGNTVIEGLLLGRHAVYTYPVPHVRVVERTVNAVGSALRELKTLHDAGNLGLNEGGRMFIREAFDEATLRQQLVALVAGLSVPRKSTRT